jgi:predicted metal-dependent phosphotriesterase family hydrolase
MTLYTQLQSAKSEEGVKGTYIKAGVVNEAPSTLP